MSVSTLQKIQIAFHAEQFTEKTFDIPIEIQNAPIGIQLNPSTANDYLFGQSLVSMVFWLQTVLLSLPILRGLIAWTNTKAYHSHSTDILVG